LEQNIENFETNLVGEIPVEQLGHDVAVNVVLVSMA
jgi:hypothetical protein